MKLWRFLLPIAFQIALILAIPAQAVLTHLNGTTVILQTVSVDPYDFLRGYYQVLNYDISLADNLKDLPGWKDFPNVDPNSMYVPQGTPIYVVLEKPDNAENGDIPNTWTPVKVEDQPPENLPEDQVFLEGISQYSQIEYGLEEYYMPEDQREAINAHIRDVQGQAGQTDDKIPFVVEVKVNKDGNAVPVSLWVGDRNYRF